MNSNFPNSGYVTCFGARNSPQVPYFKIDASITLERPNETSTFVSIAACAAWNDDLQLTIAGYRDSVQTNVHATILRFGQLQPILLQWRNINKIIFKPSGGTAHP